MSIISGTSLSSARRRFTTPSSDPANRPLPEHSLSVAHLMRTAAGPAMGRVLEGRAGPGRRRRERRSVGRRTWGRVRARIAGTRRRKIARSSGAGRAARVGVLIAPPTSGARGCRWRREGSGSSRPKEPSLSRPLPPARIGRRSQRKSRSGPGRARRPHAPIPLTSLRLYKIQALDRGCLDKFVRRLCSSVYG